MGEDRLNVPMRLRRSLVRSLDEAKELQGGISREATVNLLLQEGLMVLYERRGIEGNPAAMAAEMLRVVSEIWESDLSDEEIKAIGVARAAMERIAQIRARTEGEP